MTVGTKTITGSFSSDGTDNSLANFSPAAGELYYVDNVVISCDGTGGQVSNYSCAASIWASAQTPDTPSDEPNGYARGNPNVDDTTNATNVGTVGSYLTEDETLYITDNNANNAATAATFSYVVTLRRVL